MQMLQSVLFSELIKKLNNYLKNRNSMKSKIFTVVVLLLMLISMESNGQMKFTVSGYIKDASDGEALIGATVQVKETRSGNLSNEYGFYSMTLPSGAYTVEYSYIGYTKTERMVVLSSNQNIDIELSNEAEQLKEVVISGDPDLQKSRSLEMSTAKLDMGTISKIPSLLGETDIIRSIQLLPGVSTVGEGASGFNVRGGTVGQNLILLDEAPVYNSSHMLGFFSVFNPDAVKDVKLYKGAIPATYGGRLASLLDVRMKEGNNKKFEANGGVGLIFSRLALEAPIVKDKGSFIIAARRSYIDVLAAPVLSDGFGLNFYDVTAKSNYEVNKNNKIYLSGYLGRDNFAFGDNQGINWGNKTATLRWNHLFNSRLFANFTTVYSNFDYQLQFGEDNTDRVNWQSDVTNFIFKPQFSYFINSTNELNFGGELINYTFNPAGIKGASNGDAVANTLQKKYGREASAYINNNVEISPRFAFEYGLRFSHYDYIGPNSAYTYRDTIPGKRRAVASEKKYGDGEIISTYNNLEPRFSTKFQLTNTSSLKASYNRMAQYIHLISNTTASNPLDVWTPTSNNLKPEIGDQFTVGYFKDFGAFNQFEFSAEGYYRTTQNQVEYIDGADLLINKYLEGDLLSGKGRAYGLELYAKKKTGRFNGWVSYTLGKSELQVDGINNGNWYPMRYDQRHNLKIVAFYELNKRWSISADFVYTSGTPTTFPTSRYYSQGILVPFNGNTTRNNVRLADYHRLDVSFRLEGREFHRDGSKRRNRDYWVFSVYNVYARKNPFSIYFSQSSDRLAAGTPIKSSATQVSIIGTLIPSVSYNFKF